MFMKGVSLGLKGTPYRMIVREPTRFYGTHVRSDERQFLQDLLDNSQVAGAIIQRDPFANTTDLIEQLQRQGKVLVFVDTLPPVEITADYVGSANLSAARQCVEYLIGLGHRNIVCLAESEAAETMRQRVLGFWRAMRQAGLENTATCLIAENLNRPMTRIYPAGRFTDRCAVHGGYAEWSQALVSKLLDLPERPTAAFVGCDVLAHSVAALLEGAGLRIPEDISILGFDWLARWNTDEPDDLTTAGQDFEGFGRHAVDLLLDRLASDTYRSARHILLPAPLVIRSSTGPVSTAEAADSNVGDSPSVAL
jgi:DNA-binding LacI/PurR family transcriptional regulator